MLCVASICTPCCVLLEVVVQNLKLVKFLATRKRIQQLPTMLRPFALGYSFLSHATHLFRSPYVTIPNFCHFWLNSVSEYQPYPDLLCSALGSSSNDNGEGNDNVKKVVRLDLQNNNFARALRFFLHFFAVTARPQRKSASFHVFWRMCTQDKQFHLLFVNLDTVF